MRQLITILILIASCSFTNAQLFFDGLSHEIVGPVEYEIVNDSITFIHANPEEITGVDIRLGSTKGFGFSYASIDPIINSNGAFHEWRMIGNLNGQEDQLLWSEKHQINNENGLVRTEVIFDTSPIEADSNGIRIQRNGEMVYEGAFERGLIFTIEIDTQFVSIQQICEPNFINAVWDATCVYIDTLRYQHLFRLPNGEGVEGDSNDVFVIETFAKNPQNPPTVCTEVESRSFGKEKSMFYNEGVVMFEERIPFYAIGDVIYETNPEYLKVFELDPNGREGLRIPLKKANNFDLDWENLEAQENFRMEISSRGMVDGSIQLLGVSEHLRDPNTGEFVLLANFSSLGSDEKNIQILKDGNIVNEFPGFSEYFIGTSSTSANGCGKLAQIEPDSLGGTKCYYYTFEDDNIFSINGVESVGDEIRILSESNTPVAYLSEFKVLMGGVNEWVIRSADQMTTNTIELSFDADAYHIYPNPIKHLLTIEKQLGGDLQTNYIIYNLSGQALRQGQFDGLKTQIDLKFLQSGGYFLQLWDGKKITTQKFFKIN